MESLKSQKILTAKTADSFSGNIQRDKVQTNYSNWPNPATIQTNSSIPNRRFKSTSQDNLIPLPNSKSRKNTRA